MAQILDKQGLQHYANKMCNADNRKVGSKSLPTVLNDIDIAIDGFKTLFESEYGTPVNMELENNENVFSIGTGTNINKKDDVENSFTDVELSGNSLVNLCPQTYNFTTVTTKGEAVLDGLDVTYNSPTYRIKAFTLTQPLKPNTTYTAIVNILSLVNSGAVSSYVKYSDGEAVYNQFSATQLGLNIKKFTTSNKIATELAYYLNGGECSAKISGVIILEGDWTNKPIPQYFEGLKSIGEKEDGNHKISISSIGNNLIDFKNPIKNVLTYAMGFPFEMTKTLSSLGSKYKLLDNGFYFESPNNSHNQGVGFYVKCKKNTNYILSCMVDFKNAPAIKCQGVYSNEIPINNYINRALLISKEKISTSDFSVTFNSQNYDYLLFYFGGSWLSQMTTSVDMKFTNIQLEEISKTPYQPYKEDKKEISLNEPLRGLPNGIRDTIEKVNGEWKIVRRCGEVVLDGNRTWTIWSNNTDGQNLTYNAYVYSADLDITKKTTSDSNLNVINDKVTNHYRSFIDRTGESIIVASSIIHLSILRTKLETQDTTGLKKWLSQNPIKVVYELATPIIEDISPVTLQCWKNGTIYIDEVLPVESTHTVALNKSAQIQKNIEELSILRNRIEALEKQYDNSTLNQSYELELLRLDMQLDNII